MYKVCAVYMCTSIFAICHRWSAAKYVYNMPSAPNNEGKCAGRIFHRRTAVIRLSVGTHTYIMREQRREEKREKEAVRPRVHKRFRQVQ